jgi:pimeloyl-ACP methyl ester carboxylesterase
MSEFTDRFWTSRDGLKLHYRDYAGSPAAAPARPPVVCLPGLTRNARDFEALAAHLAGNRADPWRVLAIDNRGRGDSAYSRDSASYNPLQYVDDLLVLLDELAIARFVAIGTSLGGLMTMILAMTMPQRIAAAVLNDVGPEIDPAGLARIRDYVGQGRSFATWMHAARALHEAQGPVFPQFELSDWLAMAKRSMVVGSNGRIVFDYDMKIAEPFNQPGGAAPVDLWPGITGLSGKPVLLLRGEHSDILSPATHLAMAEHLPGSEAVTVPQVGHAPTLDEPEAVAAIDRLLARVS